MAVQLPPAGGPERHLVSEKKFERLVGFEEVGDALADDAAPGHRRAA